MRLLLVLVALSAMPFSAFAKVNASDVTAGYSPLAFDDEDEAYRKMRADTAATYEEFLEWATPEEIAADLDLSDTEREALSASLQQGPLDDAAVASLVPMVDGIKVAVEIQKKSQRMNVTVVDDPGQNIANHAIRTGRLHHGTVSGCFHPIRLDAHHVSAKYHAPMPWSVFFYGGEALHAGDVRVPSHGCVHLQQADAKFIYGLASAYPAGQVSICIRGTGP